MPGEVVERWVSVALGEAAALQDLDDQLYVAEDDPVRLGRANRLHAAWRQWAQDAEGLLSRITADDDSARARPDVKRLAREVAAARALIRQTPEMFLERIKKARGGDVMTLEEARRELRTRHHP